MMGDVVFKFIDERSPNPCTILVDGILEGVCHILYTLSGCLRIEKWTFDAFVEFHQFLPVIRKTFEHNALWVLKEQEEHSFGKRCHVNFLVQVASS